jgi:hypothetical protein
MPTIAIRLCPYEHRNLTDELFPIDRMESRGTRVARGARATLVFASAIAHDPRQFPTLRARNGEQRREREPTMAEIRARNMMLAATLATLSLNAADAAQFTLVNASGVTLYELYIAPCGAPHWGPNQFGPAALSSSRTFTIANIQPGCYDLKVTVPFWNECLIEGATVRGSIAWTITPMMLGNAVFGECSYTAHYVSAGRLPWTWWREY